MVNIVVCLFVLDSVINDNKKKNDSKVLKILVDDNDNLIKFNYDFKNDIKGIAIKGIREIVATDNFHLEQVHALGDASYMSDKTMDVIYLGCTNSEDIQKLKDGYKLVDFATKDNKEILFKDRKYKYKTIKNSNKEASEYIHKIDVKDKKLEKELLEIIMAYKHLRSRVDNINILFKLLPKYFTLEDVRIIYELIKDTEVDKSNFRKRIMKYVKKSEEVIRNKGYRPASIFEYNSDIEEVWL